MRPKSKKQIIKEMKYLAARLITCGVNLDYYGGFDPAARHGELLVEVAMSVKTAADHWEKGGERYVSQVSK